MTARLTRSALLVVVGALALPAAPATAAQQKVVAHVWPATSYPGNVLTVSGAAPTGEVSLQQRVHRHWQTISHASSTAAGYNFSVRAQHRLGQEDLRVVQGAMVSRTLVVRVTRALFKVSAQAESDTFTGHPIVVSGTVSPQATGNVQLQRLLGTRWVTLGSGALSKTGGYTVTSWQNPGAYGLRVVKAFTKKRGRGVSVSFNVQVLASGRPTTLPLAITTAALPAGAVTVAYHAVLAATGGTAPYTWSASSLPAGLHLSSDGHLTGTPTTEGTSTAAITVVDAGGRRAHANLPITIGRRPLTVSAWGANDVGQLGDGVPAFQSTPQLPQALSGAIGVAAGTRTGYVLSAAGGVSAWGQGSSGQLGNGADLPSATPVAVTGLQSGVTAIAATGTAGFALKSDGTVWGWGSGSSGLLGVAGNANSNIAAQVPVITDVTAIATGLSTAYALESDGTVWAWGENSFGQLGNNSTRPAVQPVQVQGLLAPVVAIAAGAKTGYALQNDGTVMAWGYNRQGQIGNGGTRNPPAAVGVSGLAGVTAIAAEANGALALESDGTVRGWGDGSSGGLGSGSTGSTSTPITVDGLSGVISIAGSEYAGYAVLGDGSVQAWGFDGDGDLGDGQTVDSSAPVTVTGLSGTTSVVGGQGETVFAMAPGHVWQWGDGPAALMDRPTPADVDGLSGVTQLAADGSGAIALTSAGAAKDWGSNSLGSLGLGGTSGPITSAVTVPLRGTPVALGGTRRDPVTRYAVMSDGTLLAWGTNQYGTLGTSSPDATPTPTPVPGLTGIIAVAGGSASGYALASDGQVWSWGDNSRGELGDGSHTDRATPDLVTGLTGVVAIAAGNGAAYALDSSGEVWSWGANDIGQLGNGNRNDSPVPVQVLGSAIAIAAGDDAGYALESDGTVQDWGADSTGQLGNGTTGFSTSPVQVTGLTGVTAITASNGDGYALTSAGLVFAWGDDQRGQLGDDTATNSSVAVQVPGLSKVTAISASAMFAYAVH